MAIASLVVGDEKSARSWLGARVSRETMDRLGALMALTEKWQRSINLVSNATLPSFWQRHLVDSAQLHFAAPEDRPIWIDLGSGGGFPGLVIALMRCEQPGFSMHLVESNGKKCAFLREVARQLQLPVTVHTQRIENIAQDLFKSHPGHLMIVSARALAPLSQLLNWCAPALSQGAIGIFPKGQDVDDELADARKTWNFDHNLIQSISEPRARIVRINQFDGLTSI